MKAICVGNYDNDLILYKWYDIKKIINVDGAKIAYTYNNNYYLGSHNKNNFKTINELRKERIDEII